MEDINILSRKNSTFRIITSCSRQVGSGRLVTENGPTVDQGWKN